MTCYCDQPKRRCGACADALRAAARLHANDAPIVECESAAELWDWIWSEWEEDEDELSSGD